MGARFYFVTMIGVDLAGKLVKSCTKSFVARMHLNGLERERERERKRDEERAATSFRKAVSC